MSTISQMQQTLLLDGSIGFGGFQSSNGVLLFTPVGRIASILHFAVGMVGSILGIILLGALARFNRNLNTRSLLILSLSFADLIYCLSAVFQNGPDIYNGGFSTGINGCIAGSIVIILSTALSIHALLLLAIDRYYSICLSRDITLANGWKLTALCWTNSAFITLYPIISDSFGSSIGLMPAMEACVIAWWRPEARGISLYCMIIICASSVIIFMCYFQIVRTFRLAKKPKRAGERKVISKAERKLLIISYAITGAFVVLWTPYGILIVVSLVSESPVSDTYDAYCTVCIIINSALNPLLLYFFDARIRGSVNELLGLPSYFGQAIVPPSSSPPIPPNDLLSMARTQIDGNGKSIVTDVPRTEGL